MIFDNAAKNSPQYFLIVKHMFSNTVMDIFILMDTHIEDGMHIACDTAISHKDFIFLILNFKSSKFEMFFSSQKWSLLYKFIW